MEGKSPKCPLCEDVLSRKQYSRMQTCSCGAVSYDWHDLWPRVLFGGPRFPDMKYEDIEWIEDA